MQLVVQIFDILISGCFAESRENQSQSLYINCMKDFFQAHLPSLQLQLNFLSSLWVAHEVPVNICKDFNGLVRTESKEKKRRHKNECKRIVSSCKEIILPELQIRCLRLGEILISKSESSVGWIFECDGPGAAIIPSILVTCSSPVRNVRVAALQLLKAVDQTFGTIFLKSNPVYAPLVKELISQSEEILSDPGQLSLFLYVQLSSEHDILASQPLEKKKQRIKVREGLFSLLAPNSPAPRHIMRALLQILCSVRSLDLLKKLSPLGISLLEEGSLKTSLDEYATDCLVFIIQRLDDSVCKSLEDLEKKNDIWNFFQKALTDTQTKLYLTNDIIQFIDFKGSVSSEEICPSLVMMQQITKEFYDALPSELHQKEILSVLIDLAAQKTAEYSVKKLTMMEGASIVAKSTLKRLTIDSELIVEELSKMLPNEEKDTAPRTRSFISRASKRIVPVITIKALQTSSWTRGVTLLEIIQNKKKLKNAQRILPTLFQILKVCLQLKHQEPVEYTKQLVLASAIHCLKKAGIRDTKPVHDEEHGKIEEQQFDVETIVDCIRSTQNPHTHRHALLLLSCAAEIFPDSVLHNVMAIFAFVGTSMVRQDDEYSFEVITRTVESIIPVLVKVSSRENEVIRGLKKLPEGLEFLEGPCVEGALRVMRVFADAVPDVPPHRRLPLYLKLIETVGWCTGLPQLLLLIIEGHILHGGTKTKENEKSSSSRLELAHEMARKSPFYTLVLCCLRMVQYVKILPADKESDAKGKLLWHTGQESEPSLTWVDSVHIFDVNIHTGAQLLQYKHAILSFLSEILSEPFIVAKLFKTNEESSGKELDNQPSIDKLFQHLIQELLGYIANVAGEIEKSTSSRSVRYWKAIQHYCHQILEKVNALLPPPLFLSVVRGLLSHQLPSVRRKAADILNSRLATLLNKGDTLNDTLSEEDRESLRGILSGPLMEMMCIMEEVKDDENITKDGNINCQVALLSAKLLIRILGSNEKPNTLKPVLIVSIKVAANSLKMEESSCHSYGGILASAALCIAEICAVLKVKVLDEIHNFMPVLLSALSSPVMNKVGPNTVKLGVVTSVQRIVESLPNFLSPYLKSLIVRLCILASKHSTGEGAETTNETSNDPISLRLSSVLSKVALAIPSRVLIPSVSDSFKMLGFGLSTSNKNRKRKALFSNAAEDGKSYLNDLMCSPEALVGIKPLMEMFSHSISKMSHEELTNHLQEMELFFLSALDIRVERDSVDDSVIDEIEESVISALVSLVLKLSEASFRPFYYRLFEWASQEGTPPLRAITFYRLSSKFAEALKSLFAMFAGNLVRHAATLLDQNNLAKISGDEEKEEKDAKESVQSAEKKCLFFGEKDVDGLKSHILIKHILSTLHSVFLYDGTGHFVTGSRFETLMLPLVNQLENLVGEYVLFRERCSSVIVPTLVQLAVASADDSLWKQLNYQILLKTRHSNPKVRLAGLSAMLELGKRLGEDFLPLLPETVPFLAELMEDEEEEVESATQNALNILSDVLGEPLQKYF